MFREKKVKIDASHRYKIVEMKKKDKIQQS